MKQTITVEVLNGPGPNKTVSIEVAVALGVLNYQVIVRPAPMTLADARKAATAQEYEAMSRRNALEEAFLHLLKDPRFVL